MADFSTHVFSAAALGSFAATLCTKLLDLPMADGVTLTLAATVGGILPDIDLKVSWPSRLLFTLLGGVAALSWLFSNITQLTAFELWFAAIGLFLIVRYPLHWLFHSVTVHRGALHSIAATVTASLLMAAAAERLLGVSPLMSWMLAIFLGAGYLLHLGLDELFSVDFTGMSTKRSFGSALKLIDTDRKIGSAAVLATGGVALLLAPEMGSFVDAWSNMGESWRGTIVPAWLFATRY